MVHPDSDRLTAELPHLEPKAENGRWVPLGEHKRYLTHISHVALVAHNMTDAHPHGWKFVVDRKDARGEAGHFEVFQPHDIDNQTEK